MLHHCRLKQLLWKWPGECHETKLGEFQNHSHIILVRPFSFRGACEDIWVIFCGHLNRACVRQVHVFVRSVLEIAELKLPQLRRILILCWSLDGQDFFSLKPMMFAESWKPTVYCFSCWCEITTTSREMSSEGILRRYK